ncbi:MAG: S1 RNA-binding domain-containing protein [Clostridia bacterium]|jgi:ribosomal protein S1|nr:S1 RNA-binding domain-containing protein [Clostridia bacterium]MDD4275644.1 S1 RNA-binding domain-containing protein [Clostridia bacterium]
METTFTKEDNFKDLFESTFTSYAKGKLLKGKVVAVTSLGIVVNIGGKKDGFIENAQIKPDELAKIIIDEEIYALVLDSTAGENGCILLSKIKADEVVKSDEIALTVKENDEFELIIDSAVKGGLVAKLGSFKVFIPLSHVSTKFIKDLSVYIGKQFKVTVLEIDHLEKRITASIKVSAERDRNKVESNFWNNIFTNKIVKGIVKRFAAFGAFIDVDGIDCLAHISDLSYDKIATPSDVLELDKTYDFKVLSVDKESRRVSLGYKQLMPHPAEELFKKYSVGQVVKGKVVKLFPFGALIELEKNVDGLLHLSEASHIYIKNINEVAKVGDELEVKIISIDIENRKISFSLKALEDYTNVTTDTENE